ncbi:MAG: MarR family winged helix-turn-helix transcriptional regulator [Burkholderiaceae bacterium]
MSNPPDAFEFYDAPGHLIRRAQQIAVSIFMEETAEFDLTPVQFALLEVLRREQGLDQVTLANRVALDASTSGSAMGRLESKGLIVRRLDPEDRRRRLLYLTADGEALVLRMRAAVVAAQARILEPLAPAERELFCDLLRKLVDLNNERSRAPLIAPGKR